MNTSQGGPLRLFFYVNGFIMTTILAFIAAGIMTTYSSPFTSETAKAWMKDVNANQLFMHVIKSENHAFFPNQKSPDLYSISELTFELATNIQPTDIRTFVKSELPGLFLYDTEIAVAGYGTDLTTLPVESAPPMEVLLKERAIAKEKLESDPGDGVTPVVPGAKSVFIYHTHSYESFIPLLQGAKTKDDAISSNEKVNVIALGKKLTDELAKYGIGVEHDQTNMTAELKKKSWDWASSYSLSREIVEAAAAENKNLSYFIDIHRDSLSRDITTTVINQKEYARLFFIVGRENKNYEENLQIATELNKKLEERYPGISRGVFIKGKSEGNGVYNQDISNRALLLEVGGVENDLTELNNSIKAFAEIFSEFYKKAEMVNG
jgi:stage II sporulation protein P